MRAVGWVRIRIRGVMSGRRLNELGAQMPLRRVKYTPDGMEMDVRAGDLNRLRYLLRGSGVRMRVVKRYGIVRLRRAARHRSMLVYAGVCGLLAVLYLSQTVLQVRVTGAADAQQEAAMLSALEACGIRAGAYMSGVDKTGAAEEILRQFAGLTYAAVRRKGTTLELYVVQATPAPEVYDASLRMDVVASVGGLVTKVVALSGEALVRPGDTVVPGQVLIAGTERMPHARGAVTARVWAVGTGEAARMELTEERTGESTVQTGLRVGDRLLFMEEESVYVSRQTEEERVRLLGRLFYPVEVVRRVEYETKREVKPRTISAVKDESGARAMTNALLALKNGACVVDKRVEYSMIEDGDLRAVAVLECVMQIGEEQPRKE